MDVACPSLVAGETGPELLVDGRVVAREGTFMFNAPGALHGGISTDLTLFVHWCSGKPDEIVSAKLIDFQPLE